MTTKRHLAPYALALAVAAAPALSQAATSDFYGGSFGSLTDKSFTTYTTTVNGVGLSIQAVSSAAAPLVTVRWDGIGMSRGLLEAGELNSQLSGGGDALLLTFSQAVVIDSLDLSGWDVGLFGSAIDKASITSKGKTYALGQGQSAALSPLTTFSLGQIPASQTFMLSAEGSLSSFRLAGLNVTAAIPEASTWAMMALGLAGIGGLRRRRAG
jgi:hypothetical protein